MPVATTPAARALRWDLYCRVIDNFGDVGVCWRLARALAERGDAVRLVIDDAAALAWMAPDGAANVRVVPWQAPPEEPGDVVIEAFGCDPPPAVVQSLQRARDTGKPPVWINLEYLSAEAYVERSHGLPSPQPGGLTKWFFYPGFTAGTGGLLRDIALPDTADQAQARGWLVQRGWLAADEASARRVASLFCYANEALVPLITALATEPTTLLLTPGHAQRQIEALQAAGWQPPARLRLVALPWLPQTEFDNVLAGGDLNLVRGEDSIVRAIWAGRPFVWQIYPQDDGAHVPKLEAFIARAAWPAAVADAFRAWNGLAPAAALARALAPSRRDAWVDAALALRTSLAAGPELAASLCDFVLARMPNAERPPGVSP